MSGCRILNLPFSNIPIAMCFHLLRILLIITVISTMLLVLFQVLLV